MRKARAAYQAETEAAESAANTGTGHGSTDTADATGAEQPATTSGDSEQQFRANLTDPESRLLKTRNGWIQGYNCQTAVSDDAFIISARATQDPNDIAQFVPTVTTSPPPPPLTERTGRDDLTIGAMIGDAGYDSDANLTATGPDRLIADAKATPSTSAPPPTPPPATQPPTPPPASG